MKPNSGGLDPRQLEKIQKLKDDEARAELVRRGFTEIDFEAMETRTNRVLEANRVQKTLDRVKFDLSHFAPTKKPRK